MDARSQFRSIAVLIFILAGYLSISLAKQHPVRHAHSRHKRQHGPRNFIPDYYIMDGLGEPEYGDWGHWSAPSECSRTCGGGVAFQTRHCREIGPDGNIKCQGGSKRYFSCNIQDCPEDRDFRSEQCAEFNRVPIDNTFYDWIPYTNAPNQCELNCMPRGERFFYRHKRKVVDGTRCDDERLDVCVDGQCLPVGCDRMLGSDAREDICRECRGNGSGCTTVEGIFDNNDLQVGYNDILLIPAGATNIKVKEIQPTNNYLAVRNTTGHYYLNGNWRIDFPRDLSFIGTIFHYERKPHKFYAPESISALGPTTEAVYISLLFQERNPGIMYQYSIPRGVAPHYLAENYTWTEGDFGDCSRTCGGGLQQRSIQCVRKSDMVSVHTDLCDSSTIPSEIQQCAQDPCPPEWTAGHWSPCSESCDKGVQERQVFCTQVMANGLPTVVDENECVNAGPKPEVKQDCNTETICPSWHLGPWKPCDRLCGDGKERRDVICYRKVDGKIEVLNDRYCQKDKPETEKPCTLRPCDGVDWIVSEWSGCDEKCGLTQETRTVQCATQAGIVFPNSFCHQYRIPELVRKCESQKKCDYEWYAGQWSKCSSKCGSGVQTRKVFCGTVSEEGLIKKVDDNLCNIEEKYEFEKNCTGEDECKGDWFFGPWSQCSKACGGGQKMRKVLCLQNEKTVPITSCDANSVPFSVETCNDHSCGEDEVYTIEPTHDLSEDEEEYCEDEEENNFTTVIGDSSISSKLISKMNSSGTTEMIFILTDLPSKLNSKSLETSSSFSKVFSPSSLGSTSESSSNIVDSTSSNISSNLESSLLISASPSIHPSLKSPFIGRIPDVSARSIRLSIRQVHYDANSMISLKQEAKEQSSLSTFSGISTTTEANDSSSETSSSVTTSSEFLSKNSPSDMSSKFLSSDTSPSDVTSSEFSSSHTSPSDITSSEFSSSHTSPSDITSSEFSSSDTSPSDITSSEFSSSDTSPSDITSSEFSSSDTSPSDVTSSEFSSSDTSPSDITSSEFSSSHILPSDITSSEFSSSDTSPSDITSSEFSSSDTSPSDITSSEFSSSDISPSDVTSSECLSSSISTKLISDSSFVSSTSSFQSSTSEMTSKTSWSEFSSTTESLNSESSSYKISLNSSSTSETLSSISFSSPSSTDESSITPEFSTIDSSSTSDFTALSSLTSKTILISNEPNIYTVTSSTTDRSNYDLSSSSSITSSSSGSVSSSSSGSSSSSSDSSTFSSPSASMRSSTSDLSTTTLRIIGEVESKDRESTTSSITENEEITSTLSDLNTSSETSLITSSFSSSSGTTSKEGTIEESTAESSSSKTAISTTIFSTASNMELSASTESSSEFSSVTTDTSVSDISFSVSDVSDESDITSLEWLATDISQLWGSSVSSNQTAKTKEQKMKKCKFRKKPACRKSEFGCCPDDRTPAEGPFAKGCSQPETCNDSDFGCCPDGVSPALGKKNKGCPPSKCNETIFGCCLDGINAAQGNDYEGCPEETLPIACSTSQFGCCPDNVTAASGPNHHGCFICEGSGECETCNDTKYGCCPDNLHVASGPNFEGCEEGSGVAEIDCARSIYGCCPDGILAAEGPNFENCGVIENCTQTYFGCCPDGITMAQGTKYEGCKISCESEQYGCCDDNYTPAHGPNKEGCCLLSPFGCCPDNILYARGPNFEGCGCQYSPFGCCPDNYTSARGHYNEGCGCQNTEHGCCPNNYTPAAGPNFQGCPCYTFQFGCCPDGITTAKGPQKLGCGCKNTEFGCCSDDKTPASGPNFTGCGCEVSRFGCCPDGITESQGKNFEGCTNVPLNSGETCRKEKDRGTCRDFTVKWYYDMEYGGCTRFWYGGCEGNENRFKSSEECKRTCVEPEGKERCNLPKVEGPCEGYYPKWYYDSNRKQCGQFIYSGCLGNNNNFDTREECQQVCAVDQILDPCNQDVDEGPCQGNYRRWYYNKDYKICMEFRYGGCKPNGNNFLTQSACIEQCQKPGRMRDHCSLPREPGNCTDRQPKWFFDYAENRCMPFYYTGCEGNDNRFDTLEACEADCPPRVHQDLCMQPALVGECYNYTERWYYDVQTAYCKPFYYGGCGGNHNNFKSQLDCQRRCEPGYEPAVEETLRTTPPQPEAEPFTTEFCFYDNDVGSCRPDNYYPKWFYDRADGVCKQFLYSGCDGNRNRFESRQECEQNCGRAQDLCILPKTVGPCNGNYRQWYYDRERDACYEFDYGGCLGNQNRFNTRSDCEIRCKQGRITPPTSTPIPEAPRPVTSDTSNICHTPVDPGPCLEERPAWYYEPQRRSCQAFVYGGCGGNANRFDSEEQCERQCGKFKGQDICNIPHDVGACQGTFYKWYYDPMQRMCKSFWYGGCEGNGNRFSSIEECETICLHREEVIPSGNETFSQAICRLPMEVGPCTDGHYKRWYFDESKSTCIPFIYSGCGGNFNRFKNFDVCVKFCTVALRDLHPPPLYEEFERDPNEIIPTNFCEEAKQKCRMLHCPYGIEKYIDSEECERCRCHDPCKDRYCSAGTKCAVDLYGDHSNEISFRSQCREENKPGVCPTLAIGSGTCTRECFSDADCMGHAKCCESTCGASCVQPIPATLPPPRSQETYKPYFPGAQPPSILADQPEVTSEEGSYATLRCIVRGQPNPVVTWRKDNDLIDGSTGRHRFLPDGSLQIIGLYRSDSGIYLCTADNGLGHPAEREFRLYVQDPVERPAEVVGGENNFVVVSLGSPAVLQCYVIGWPRPKVIWWRGDQILPLSYGQYEQNRDFSLLLKTISLRDLGPYVCQAYNGIGKAVSGTVTVQAIGPAYSNNPEDKPFLKYLVSAPHRPINAVTPTRPFYKPQAHTTPMYPHVRTATSPRPPSSPPAPDVPRVYKVPLKVNISVEKTSFPVDSDISIPCDVDGYPIPKVTWFKNNEIIKSSRKIEITENNRLKIIRADGGDSGIYRCEAENQFERAMSTVQISVEGIYVHPNCTDNVFFANCELIVKAHHCQHKYYARFCCRSCTQAGQLSSYGSHLDYLKPTTRKFQE